MSFWTTAKLYLSWVLTLARRGWRVFAHHLFFRSNKVFAVAMWAVIIFGSYVAGNSFGGTNTTLAATASGPEVVVAGSTPAPTLAPSAPTPPATPAPTPTPPPATPAPVVAAPVATPVAVRLAAQTTYANNYSYGYCTYYVATRRNIPGNWGNAVNWYYQAQLAGYRVGAAPAAGAIAWTGAGSAGHVAYVEQVSGTQVYLSEMNFNGNWNRVTYRWAPASSFRYIY